MPDRYRTRGSFGTGGAFTTSAASTTCFDSASKYLVSTSAATTQPGYVEEIWDFTEPGYWRRRSKGERIALHPLITRKDRVTQTGGSSVLHESIPPSCVAPARKAKYWTEGCVLAYAWLNGALPTATPVQAVLNVQGNLADEVWTQCLARRYGTQQNLFESLAEIDKTWSMLGNPLENVRKFHREFAMNSRARRRALRSPKLVALTRFVSSEWLRYRYGIRPLMSDVQNVMKTLSKSYSGKPSISKAKAAGGTFATETTTGTSSYGAITMSTAKTNEHRYDVRASFTDMVRKNPWDDLGLNLGGFMGLAWELLPYSFVVDWFANVGDLIYANVPRVDVIPLGGTLTGVNDVKSRHYCTGITNTNPGFIMTGSVSDEFTRRTTTKVRQVRSDTGRLVFKTDFGFDNYRRVLDSAALTLQQLIGSQDIWLQR